MPQVVLQILLLKILKNYFGPNENLLSCKYIYICDSQSKDLF